MVDLYCESRNFTLIVDLFMKEISIDRKLQLSLKDLVLEPDPAYKVSAFAAATISIMSVTFDLGSQLAVFEDGVAALKVFVDDWVVIHGAEDATVKFMNGLVSFNPKHANDTSVREWTSAIQYISAMPKKHPMSKVMHAAPSTGLTVGTHLRKYSIMLGSTSCAARGLSKLNSVPHEIIPN
jgi:hypothetical protein